MTLNTKCYMPEIRFKHKCIVSISKQNTKPDICGTRPKTKGHNHRSYVLVYPQQLKRRTRQRPPQASPLDLRELREHKQRKAAKADVARFVFFVRSYGDNRKTRCFPCLAVRPGAVENFFQSPRYPGSLW